MKQKRDSLAKCFLSGLRNEIKTNKKQGIGKGNKSWFTKITFTEMISLEGMSHISCF